MTVKPESNFGRLLMKNIDAQWTRIENRHGKCIKQNSINLSPLQISWNYNNFRHGGKNYYIVQDTRSKVIKLYGGDKGRELKEKGFLYDGGQSFIVPDDWQKLGDHLFCISSVIR